MRTIYVVSHTHWDREWYHPAERFRHRLVELIDELLDGGGAADAFLLDGQTVVLEDYLAVRPEREALLARALQDYRIEAGPWYVLADELIPSGEGLVRNLLAGRRMLTRAGVASPPVLYCPDSFGHPATLPMLAAGFGKSMIILWRGFGSSRWPDGNGFAWAAPDGAAIPMYPLTRSGYELGSSLPVDARSANERWSRISREYDREPIVAVELLLNGADHHALQRDADTAIEALRGAAHVVRIERTGLTQFANAFIGATAGATLPQIAGELRDSYGFTWTLQGTLASRTPQKRRYVQMERSLLRDVEPWVALAAMRDGKDKSHFSRATWRSILLCQPHDTLCGCSIDAVAHAMDARLEAAAAQAEELRDAAIEELIGHDREIARHRQDDWIPTLVVRNRAPRTRSGVALVELVMKLADVPVGPGSAPSRATRAELSPVVNLDVTHERTESPRAYPDNDAVARFHTAVWMDQVPPFGISCIPLTNPEALPRSAPVPVVVRGRAMSNSRLTVTWDARGRVTLVDHSLGRRITNLLSFESRVDMGDLYTPSIRGPKFSPRLVATRLLAHGPLTAVLEQQWRMRRKDERLDLRLRVVLDAGATFLRFGILGDSAARDHRLRLVINSDVPKPRVFADAAFSLVERKPVRVTRADRKMETPQGTDPLHRYVSLFGSRSGVSVYSDGLTEYEQRDGQLLVTLLRAVGELSRNDLPERPGHAGWPSPAPEAQCIGPFEAEFGVLLHGARSTSVLDEIERTADDVLFPLTGMTLRSALAHVASAPGVELVGEALAMAAIKQSEDAGWVVLRCVNLSDAATQGTWRFDRELRDAKLARLDETPLSDIPVAGRDVSFHAPAHGVVTVLVR
ncbi:MAG TPA: glycoside hydrolase family 38 C-terminal domain-containing protein [Gemmatimonadaceae bacterium]|nr:glycoside hydrolase family 38 C-terminal domain-containing protein [Gemmatimonadaceae bacterium]